MGIKYRAVMKIPEFLPTETERTNLKDVHMQRAVTIQDHQVAQSVRQAARRHGPGRAVQRHHRTPFAVWVTLEFGLNQ